MQISFKGKVALVTGASAGIGLAAAQAFAEAGAKVAMADVAVDKLNAASDALRAAGHDVIAIRCDVSDRDQVNAMMDIIASKFGRLDAAFNNAGVISETTSLLDTADEEFDRLVDVNLRGLWYCLKAELKYMVKQGVGAIVNCSSIGGLTGAAYHAAYSASKHGVTGLTRTAALEYIGKGIRINAVAPGMIDTPMNDGVSKNHDPDVVKEMLKDQPIGRFGKAAEVAAAAVWLCSDAASLVVGHTLAVDGGYLAR